jgi:hypothetical protein
MLMPFQLHKIKKLRGVGPLANYADRATAACWRSSELMRIEVLSGQRNGPPPPVLGHGFFQVAPQLSSRGWVDPGPLDL